MLSFLKNTTIPCLKQKLVLIYILNALDILFTFGLLKTGLFEEVNALMVPIVTNAFLSIIVKLIIPACLMIYILLKLDELDDMHLPICNIAVTIVFLIYSMITVMHFVYFAFFIYTIV
ncbi:MAG: DUF5658 family protein [Cellulosilyticaceae bacterium]